jgi:hypothetical protein
MSSKASLAIGLPPSKRRRQVGPLAWGMSAVLSGRFVTKTRALIRVFHVRVHCSQLAQKLGIRE